MAVPIHPKENMDAYHGPHVVLSRAEIERLHELYVNHFLQTACPVVSIDAQIQAKLDAALKSHPDFMKPAK
jgi:hypothetical protein